MSISNALNNAITGLNASTRMAEVVSSNVANALTEGYGRRSVNLSSVNLAGQGAGVRVDGIQRDVNEGVLSDRRLASASLGSGERLVAAYAQLESAFGVPSDESGLSGRLNAFEQSLILASNDPASEQRLDLVFTRLDQLTTRLQSAASQVQVLRQQADADIATDIATLNRSLQNVESLNADIVHTKLTGGDVSPLMDSQQVLLDQISEIVPIRLMDRDNGAVAIMTSSGEVMLDGPAAEYAFTPTPTIVADMTLSGGVLSGISRNGTPMGGDGIGKLAGGTLGASFALRDQILPEAQTALDQLAADLITRFEDTATDPSLTAGDPGLLTDGGSAYDVLNLAGLSSRIAINSAFDPQNGGSLSRFRDGASALTSVPVGESDQILRWQAALSTNHTSFASVSSLSASGQFSTAIADISSSGLLAEQDLSFSSARWDTLNSAVLADGVDTDFEMQMLLRIEQSYSANAKLIQTADSMLQTLMEL